MSNRGGIAWIPALLIAGCCFPQAEATKPVATSQIPFSVEAKEAYARTLRAIVKADLSVELKDADGGIVQTEWHSTGTQVIGIGSILQRRLRFKVILESGTCSVKPQAEQRMQASSSHPFGPWQDGRGMTVEEENLHEALVEFLRLELTQPQPAVQ